ncbi:MAG: hypothetical protein WD066_13160 [Planctomycetaceae bacterium]
MGDLLKSIGPLIPRPDGTKLGFISREASGLPGRSPVSIRERADGGMEFGPAEPLSDARRKEFSDRNTARHLSRRTGEPAERDGESLVDSLRRLRIADVGQRSDQRALSRATRLGHNAQRHRSQPLRDGYKLMMRDIRRRRTADAEAPQPERRSESINPIERFAEDDGDGRSARPLVALSEVTFVCQ